MKIIICPGIHSQRLTDSFTANLKIDTDLLVLPTQQYLPYGSWDIYRWLERQLCSLNKAEPLLFITFSAGVVGGMGAAIAWQIGGGNIRGLIAIDGWGVPIIANFPIYRLSHDYFTHWSSAILGAGEPKFLLRSASKTSRFMEIASYCLGMVCRQSWLQNSLFRRYLLTKYDRWKNREPQAYSLELQRMQ